MPDYVFRGYIELHHGLGLVTLELVRQDDGSIAAWVGGDLADDVDGVDEFAQAYGEDVYDSLVGYGEGVAYSIYDEWDE